MTKKQSGLTQKVEKLQWTYIIYRQFSSALKTQVV